MLRVVLVVALGLLVPYVESHSSSLGCGRSVAGGAIIMSSSVVESQFTSVQLAKGGVAIACDVGVLTAGDQGLTLQRGSTGSQYGESSYTYFQTRFFRVHTSPTVHPVYTSLLTPATLVACAVACSDRGDSNSGHWFLGNHRRDLWYEEVHLRFQ